MRIFRCSGWRTATCAAAVMALLSTHAVFVPGQALAGSASAAGSAASPAERSVQGRAIASVPLVAGAEDLPAPVVADKPIIWPKSGTAEVAVPAAAAIAGAGALPVRVGAGADQGRAGVAPARVRVETLDAQAVSRLGGVGLGVRVRRADGVRDAGRVRVELDYSGFANAYGAGFADRLRLVRLPACVLDGVPDGAAPCVLQRERVPARNDLAARRLVSDVEVSGDPAPLLMVESSATGTFSGNFAATDLSATGRWQVGLSSGAFTYSYPVPEAASVAGGGPDLDLSYTSTAVDGMTAASNNQSGWTGLGWTLSPGFIERRYKPCADDPTGSGKRSDQKNWGHLCWESPDENDGQAETTDPTNSDLVLSLDGQSSRIVRDRLTGGYKTEEDFGWRLDYVTTAGPGGQPYWLVTTQDGEVHRFGYRRDSMWQVPYAGDDPGEPCRPSYLSGGSTYPGMCQGPWRWNLDQVVDADENVTTLYWKREPGKYRWYSQAVPGTIPTQYEDVPIDYDRGGYLDYVEWGTNTKVAGSKPVAKTVFNLVSRCSSTTTRDDPLANPYPIDTGTGNLSCLGTWDVPNDLLQCTIDQCLNGSPAFFVVRRLDSIVTYSANPAGGWDDVAKLQLRYKYVQSPDNGQNGCCTPALWLDYIRPAGLAGTGEIRLPAVSFQAVQFNGRVNYGPELFGLVTAPRGILPRIGTVYNGLGGRLDVTYGRTRACPDGGSSASNYASWYNAVQWDRADWDCFRVFDFWFPTSEPMVFYGVYHKYLVTQVVQKDLVGGSPDVVTRYEYQGRPAWARPIDYLGTLLPTGNGSQTIETGTWSEARGYDTVRVLTGSGADPAAYTVDTHTFFRGMYDDPYADGTPKSVSLNDFDGNPQPDRRWLAGSPLQQRSWRMTAYHTDPAQRQYTEVDSTRYGYARTVTGDGPGVLDPAFVAQVSTRVRELLDSGAWRYTESRTDYDEYGLPKAEVDLGVDGVSDSTCTTTTYARNTTQWMIDFPSKVEKRAGEGCTTGAVLSRTVTLYDGGTDPAANPPTDGNVTEARTWTDESTVSVSKAGFDSYGRIVSATDPLGKTTTTTYNPAVNWPTSGVTVTGPLGFQTTTWGDRLTGQVTKVLDVDNNRVSEAAYDPLGRIVKLWNPGQPSTGDPSATMAYTIAYDGGIGQPTAASKTTTSQRLSGTGTGAKWLIGYGFVDGWGRAREVQAASPAGGRVVTSTTYDGRGLAQAVAEPAHNASAAGSGLLNPDPTALPAWTKNVYDGQEQPVATVEQSYSTELRRATFEYRGADGYVVRPPEGGALLPTEYWSDGQGRVTKVVEQVYYGVEPQVTQYEYNLNGDLTKMVDANGNVRTFTYDWNGQRLTVTDPDAGTTTYRYDLAGQLLSTVDGTGQKVSYSYDDLGRRTATWAGEAGTGTKLAAWRYDTVAKGQLGSATSYSGGNAYTDEMLAYDAAGRPTRTLLTIPASEGPLTGAYEFTGAYDVAGHQIEVGMPAAGGLPAEKVTTGYTDLGFVDRLTSDFGGGFVYVNASTYSKTGLPTEHRYGPRGQIKRNLTWDEATGRLTNITTQAKADTTAPATAQNDDFFYDLLDNVTRIVDRAQPTAQSECFNYDTRSRLIFGWTTTKPDCSEGWWYSPDGKGADPYWRAYTYDKVGNILSQDTTANNGVYTYPAAGAGAVRPNAVSSIQWPNRTDTYGYNAVGQLTSRTVAGQSTTYAWDPLGRLSSATTNGQTTTDVYDASGQRLIRREPGRTTLYMGQMELDLVGTTVSARRYYTAGDGSLVAVRNTAGLTWLLADPQRSEQLAIDDATSRVDRQRYLPFGARRGARDDIGSTDRGFLGQTEDASTGLVALGARYYDATIGKFISPDPILDTTVSEWANPYAYAGNNPVSLSDPSGLTPCLEPGDCKAKKPKAPPPPKKKAKKLPCNPTQCDHRAAATAARHEQIRAKNQVTAHKPKPKKPTCFSDAQCDHQDAKKKAKNDEAAFKKCGGTVAACSHKDEENRKHRDCVDVITLKCTKTRTNRVGSTGPDEDKRTGFSLAAPCPVGVICVFAGSGGSGGSGSRRVPWMSGDLPAAEDAALEDTLAHIRAGTRPNGPTSVRWGTRFNNRDGDLPGGRFQNSPYEEYRVAPTAGTNPPGPLRVVKNTQTGETYYTWTHYGTDGNPPFVRIR